jgi:hypothetical protein
MNLFCTTNKMSAVIFPISQIDISSIIWTLNILYSCHSFVPIPLKDFKIKFNIHAMHNIEIKKPAFIVLMLL